jgi:hypothetical protein
MTYLFCADDRLLLTALYSHIDLIIRVIKPILSGEAYAVEVKAASEKLFNETLHAAIAKTVFNDTCRSASFPSSAPFEMGLTVPFVVFH